MPEEISELQALLETSNSLPVLFIGSGMSRRYLGSPDWTGLIEHFSRMCGRDARYFITAANSDLPTAATLLAEEFFKVWWESDIFAESRALHSHNLKLQSDPLKLEVARYISGLEYSNDEGIVAELNALASVHATAVITTNWDDVIERSLPDFDVYVGQEDVIFSTTHGIGEIYKIHGSVSEPLSLVLTKDDYDIFWDKNHVLVAKMLMLFVEHPVLIIGYSISDPHIQRMLQNLLACLTESQRASLRNRIIFVARPNDERPVGLTKSTMTLGSSTLSFLRLATDDFLSLFGMLSTLPHRFPPKLLRQLRENVYELAQNTEPTGRIFVMPLEDENLDEVQVVLGVGIMERLGQVGYSSLSRRELIQEMLIGSVDHNHELLISQWLPRAMKRAKFSPVFYPLYLAGRLDADGQPDNVDDLPKRARDLIRGIGLEPYPARDLNQRLLKSFRELVDEDLDDAINIGVGCTFKTIEDVVLLKDVLLSEAKKDVSTEISTKLAKLACKFDRIVYGPEWEGDKGELHAALAIPQVESKLPQTTLPQSA